jgi:O-antigen/teichoic acid export membrane protein
LSRLWVEDKEEFVRVTRGALHSVALLVMPMALGCALYPALGVSIFGKQSFGPSEDDLRVLSLFLFLVYFTMPIGICVLAAGKQRAWSLVQCLCVVVSLVFDPLLTPWFEHKYKNGGLGPSVASVISELFVVSLGLWLMPRGVFDARFRRTLFFAVISGGAMATVAWLLRSINPFLAAPVAVLAYAAALYGTGEITRDDIHKVKGAVLRKLNRAR